jgi:DNA-binding LytR/AlgR family response regulator
MKVLIIEDEGLIAKNLQRLLREIEPDIEILSVVDSVSAAVKWFKTNEQPDLLFMDIQLSDGVSFDIFSQVKIDKPIIFTTAYDDYAIKAFKHNSIDYLLKPIDKVDLKAALLKFHRIYGQSSGKSTEIMELVTLLNSKQPIPFKERFLVHHKSGYIPVKSDSVSIFHKDQIIYLFTTSGQKYVTDYNTLDEIEEIVNPVSFFRANRQTLIYKGAVESIQKHFTGKIEVRIEGHEELVIDVSREKAQEFKTWLEND